MAVATTYNQAAIDAIADALVKNGYIDGSGNIILTLRDDTTVNIGAVPLLTGTLADIQPSPGTAALGDSGKAPDARHVHGQPPFFSPTGVGSATQAGRYIGAVTSGNPTGGPYVAGDFCLEKTTGSIRSCITGGSPGTWVTLGPISTVAADINPLGLAAAAGADGKAADSAHVHWGLSRVAATAFAGFSLQNGTPDILTWTAPNDGVAHTFLISGSMRATSSTTGGEVKARAYTPDGGAEFTNWTLSSPTQATGAHPVAITSGIMAPATTLYIEQTTAMTAGGAKIWLHVYAD